MILAEHQDERASSALRSLALSLRSSVCLRHPLLIVLLDLVIPLQHPTSVAPEPPVPRPPTQGPIQARL
eukprot:1142854-Pelagomonas_calceolata.AAC.3